MNGDLFLADLGGGLRRLLLFVFAAAGKQGRAREERYGESPGGTPRAEAVETEREGHGHGRSHSCLAACRMQCKGVNAAPARLNVGRVTA
jgi:hypothetical protein